MSQPQNKADYDFLPGHPVGHCRAAGFSGRNNLLWAENARAGQARFGYFGIGYALQCGRGIYYQCSAGSLGAGQRKNCRGRAVRPRRLFSTPETPMPARVNKGWPMRMRWPNLTATKLDLDPAAVLVTSTGVIGHLLPMDKIRQGVAQIELHEGETAGTSASFAIMTTDTRPKRCVVRLILGGQQVIIGGMCKGAGMIYPNLATMLCYITSDVAATPHFLQSLLSEVVQDTFNMITVDGDSSTNDLVLVLANGKAGNPTLGQDATASDEHKFKLAFGAIMTYLAKEIARDGEGATKLLEITVRGALDKTQARLAARTAVGSNLTKAAMYGNDPNWGRIIAAIGRSGAQFDVNKVDITIAGITVMQNGVPQAFDKPSAQTALNAPEVFVVVDLHTGGGGEATAWGCDLTQEYVVINSEYET